MGFSVTVIVPFYKFDVNGNKINIDNFELIEKSNHEVNTFFFKKKIVLNEGIFPVRLYKTNYTVKQMRNKENIMENAYCRLNSKKKQTTEFKVWFIRSKKYYNKPNDNVKFTSFL